VSRWERVATLRGHASEVWAIRFSPDGTRLASGSMGGDVHLWDWPSGDCLQTFRGHGSYVRAVSFSPDGALLASSSYDSTIRLWDLAQPAEQASPVVTLPGPGEAAQLYVAFSPDGSLLASAGADGTVCVWEVGEALAGRPPLYVLAGHTGKAHCVSLRHDGRLLASSGDDGTIRLWDVSDVRWGVACVQVLQIELPYARLDIAGVTGLTPAQIAALRALGAVENG
ncbi:MAG TPA: WD40 repeat domain-containing protein, partial [Candidatus Tectomicrobia bacterium]